MIRAATPGDIDAIVALHCRVLHWSINGRLGPDHVRKMYAALLGHAETVAFVACKQHAVIGFLIASTNYDRARARIRASIGLGGVSRVLLGSLLHPLDWIDLFESATLVPYAMRKSRHKAELLAWVTDSKDAFGRIAATKCMLKTLEELKSRGCVKCLAQILRSNREPNKFHERMGSRVIASYFRNKVYLIDC